MTQELADAEEARESVFEFHTELRRRDGAGFEPGPALRVYLELDGRAVPSRLAWTAIDGAHSAIAFHAGTAEFTGVHRGADGIPVQLRGRIASRRAYPALPPGVQPGDVLTFDTQENGGGPALVATDGSESADADGASADASDDTNGTNGDTSSDPTDDANDAAGANDSADSADSTSESSTPSDASDAASTAPDDASGPQIAWRRTGKMRLLLDDGRGCALRDLQWEDTRGVTGAVSFGTGRVGFLGYLSRPGQEPVGYRGFAVPGRTVPNSEDLLKELEEFGRQAVGMAQDLLGRVGGWLGGGGGGNGGNGPRPA